MIKKITAWLSIEKNYLLAWLGLAFLLRLAYVIKTGSGGLSPDAESWMNVGWSIASGQGFGGSWRPPGFAFFLAGIFAVFGKSIIAVKLSQTVLATATLYLVYRTARELFNDLTARITLALLSFYPYLVAYTADVISETFLAFMISAAVYCVVRTVKKPSWGNLALAGFLIGCAGLTKSVVLPFFMLAGAWIWWRSGSFKAGFMVGVFALLTIMPWTLRNYFHYDKSYIMPVSTPWFSLYGSSCDTAFVLELTGESDAPQSAEISAAAPPKDWAYLYSLPVPERDRICKEKALAWIKADKGRYCYLLYLRAKHFWRLYPMMAYRWQKYAAMATSGVYIPLAFFGILLSWRNFRNAILPLALLVSYTAVHLFFATSLRYRIPVDPYFMMFTACALALAWARLKKDKGAQAGIDDTGERFLPQTMSSEYERFWYFRQLFGYEYAVRRLLSAGDTVLEVGSGEGYGADILSAACAWLTALDRSPEAAAHAAAKYKRENLNYMSYEGDKLPFPDASFDKVVMLHCIEHVAAAEPFLSEVARVLKKGGRLLISTPNKAYRVREFTGRELETTLKVAFPSVELLYLSAPDRFFNMELRLTRTGRLIQRFDVLGLYRRVPNKAKQAFFRFFSFLNGGAKAAGPGAAISTGDFSLTTDDVRGLDLFAVCTKD